MKNSFPFWKSVKEALPPVGERILLRFSHPDGHGEAWGERKIIDGQTIWSFSFNGGHIQPIEWQVSNDRQMNRWDEPPDNAI